MSWFSEYCNIFCGKRNPTSTKGRSHWKLSSENYLLIAEVRFRVRDSKTIFHENYFWWMSNCVFHFLHLPLPLSCCYNQTLPWCYISLTPKRGLVVKKGNSNRLTSCHLSTDATLFCNSIESDDVSSMFFWSDCRLHAASGSSNVIHLELIMLQWTTAMFYTSLKVH